MKHMKFHVNFCGEFWHDIKAKILALFKNKSLPINECEENNQTFELGRYINI